MELPRLFLFLLLLGAGYIVGERVVFHPTTLENTNQSPPHSKEFYLRLLQNKLPSQRIADLSYPDFALIRVYAQASFGVEQNIHHFPQCPDFTKHSSFEDKRYRSKFYIFMNARQDAVVVFRAMYIFSRRNHWVVWRLFLSRCRLAHGHCGRVHYGIQKAYLRLRQALQRLLEGAQSVRFVGLSLGGAIALMAAFDFQVGRIYPRLVVKEVVTFGAPRIGDATFEHQLERARVADFRASTTVLGDRVQDMITNMPALWLGYSNPVRKKFKIRSTSKFRFHRGQDYLRAMDRIRVVRDEECPLL